jgi:hypothetical protein
MNGCWTPVGSVFMICWIRCTTSVRPASRSAPHVKKTSTTEMPWRDRDSTWRTFETADTAFSIG